MTKPVLLLATVLALTACAGTDQDSFCFPVQQEDLFPPADDQFQGMQLVCSLDRIRPGAREKYIERYPELQVQTTTPDGG